ncbi:hypothetical protein PP744_gp012 [Rhizobium phage RHph_N38]|uniref:Uncharacterized protein n=1 Tax=Rhizobium phage RHph_N38 TaxID=2509750 RepID=A0A7S5R3K7_9CAUD|nr:hypothetical protein PP744_gp012 [Rhizobium phage RHph_N38]QIG70475.1 hypothetical protein EVB89_012 [Rhizobium phage RHph_N38]
MEIRIKVLLDDDQARKQNIGRIVEILQNIVVGTLTTEFKDGPFTASPAIDFEVEMEEYYGGTDS